MKHSSQCLIICLGREGQLVALNLLSCCILFGVFPLMVLPEFVERSGGGCGHTVVSQESGTLSSRNYPGTYPNSTSCVWKIQVTQGKAIILKFSDLDIEAQNCELDYLKVVQGPSEETKRYCRTLDPAEREVLLDTDEVTIHFESTVHVSGRGFLLSYATSDHSDLISCLDRSSHYTEELYSKYCPAGCKDVAGDVFGDATGGYRDTSVLCKAAVHAGVIADASGGQITVIQSKGLGRYNGVRANGISSKEGSLSERMFLFNGTVHPGSINKVVTFTDPTAITRNWNITEPVSYQEVDLGVKIGIAVSVVLFLFLLLAVVCIYWTWHGKKTKEDACRLSGDHSTGCWKRIKQPFLQHHSTEFAISYNHEKPLQKLDLVTYDMADYHEFVTIGTVTRKGSTFKPMDTEVEDELLMSETESLYDNLQKTTRHEYALPLTTQEPEYATPIIKRHAIKNIYTPKSGYKVPNITHMKKASDSFISFNNSSTSDSSGGSGYQIPQCLSDSKMSEDMKYDQPRHSNLTTVGYSNDYQKPQSSSTAHMLYSTPRDCVKSVNHEQQ